MFQLLWAPQKEASYCPLQSVTSLCVIHTQYSTFGFENTSKDFQLRLMFSRDGKAALGANICAEMDGVGASNLGDIST